MGPQRATNIEVEELRDIIRDVIHEELKMAFGPTYGSEQDNPNDRVQDMFFLRALRRKSESIGSKIVSTFLALVLAGLATLGILGKFPFVGPTK